MASVRPVKTRKKTKTSSNPARRVRPRNTKRKPTYADDRLKGLLDLASEWYWEQDEHYRFTQLTGGALEQAGFNTKDYVGTTRWDNGAAPLGNSGGWDEHKAVLRAHQPFTNFIFTRTDSKGAVQYISTSGQPIFDAHGRFKGYRGVAADITARRRDERLLALEHAVNRSLATAETLTGAVQAVMRAVCESEGWECGRYYDVDEKAGLLRFVEAWGVSDPAVVRYLEALRARVLPLERGLKGRTYHAREPQWEPDTGRHQNLAKAHLGSARDTFIVPAMAEGKVIGMLCFTNRVVREPDARLLQAARVIGSQIGQFVQRKQAEEVLRESEARFRSLTVLSSDWFWEQDAEFRFTRLEGRHVTGDSAAFKTELGKTHEEIGVEVEGGWAAYRALFQSHQPFRDILMWYTAQDGHLHYMSVSGEPQFDNAAHFIGYRGVGADITERKRAEQLLGLEHNVNRCLAAAENLTTSLRAVLRAVCESEGWECGRYFRVDESAGLLYVLEDWGIDDPAVKGYLAASREKPPALHRGVKGRAWSTCQPLWGSETNRSAHLSEQHLGTARAAFAFPAISEGKAIGIVSFTSRDLREPDPRLLQAVRVIGSQIGQFVERKRAEQATLRLGRMFAALSATNDAIVHAKSPEDLYQQVCDAAVHGGKFTNTSVLIAEPGSMRAKVVAAAGRSPKELKQSFISIDETIPEGRGLVGLAFRTQKFAVSNDFLNDERTAPWHDIGRSVGCRSAAALPLSQAGRSIGAVLIHYDELNAFDDETVKLLERMAENVSFALDNFEHEAERRRSQERIQYLATHDGLTDLPNRVMFSQVLNMAIETAKRYKRHFAVLFIDLDRFKIINDTLGHEAGDTLLQEMSKRITENLRSSDVIARLGGDEFVVLVQEVNEPEQVAVVARKLLSAVIKPVMIMGQECRVTASVGICMYPNDAEDEQALMKNADIAMYLAKEEGKNNFQFYSKEIKTQSLERLTLETNLRRALEREEFFLHYQAKLDLKSRKITGVEALIRWTHPERGLVSPLQFIPLAEETGLIVPIGKWVLRTACNQNIAWQRAGLAPVCMAVNLSPRQFADENLLTDLAAVLDQTGMNPALLELEITESMVMGNVDRAAKQLNAIKQMGVRLAIDDFGTGYSSLAQIKRFPIDTIKVDRSFIRELPRDAEDKAITEAIIAMGKSLSLTVVAEGVETEEQQQFLREHACNEMQGYYFSKPVAADKFAELLRTHVPGPEPEK